VPNASELRRGGRVELDGEPYGVLDVHFQSPSARGAATLVKTKVRNLRTGNVFDRTFKAQDRIVEPQVELRPVQYLYTDDGGYHFMDGESYEQFSLSGDELGDAAAYLIEGLRGIRSVLYNDRVISIELPNSIVLRVAQTDPAIKGATAQAQTKPATLETGLVIQVPAYLESGELVQVDTREARFIGRAKG
jgi:elongation factor P